MNQVKSYLFFFIISICAPAMINGMIVQSDVTDHNGLSEEKMVSNPKRYLHTDQPYYLAGESIYFRQHIANGPNESSFDDNLTYVELLNDKNEVIVQGKVKPVIGKGTFASIEIPNTLSTGKYRLVVYTNWMKNYGNSDHFSERRFIIYGISEEHKLAHEQDILDSISFYPEGGRLVNGLTSKVAIKVFSQTGRGLETAGKIVDGENKEIATFNTNHVGVGTFILRPESGKNYRALINHLSDTLSFDLPKTHNQGVVIQVSNTDDNRIKVIGQFRDQPLNNSLSLVLKGAQGIVYYSAEITPKKEGFYLVIPKENLPSGLIEVVLFDGNNVELCKRWIFKSKTKSQDLAIESHPIVVGTREKVKIGISAEVDATLSVSVSSRIPKSPTSSIYSQLVLSPVSKNIGWVLNSYPNLDNPQSLSKLDNILLTFDLNEKGVSQSGSAGSNTMQHVVESNLIIKGTVYSVDMKPFINQKVAISMPGELASYECRTDSFGRLKCPVFDYYGQSIVHAQSLESQESLIFQSKEGFWEYERKEGSGRQDFFAENDIQQVTRELDNCKINGAFEIDYGKVQFEETNPLTHIRNNNYSSLYDYETKLSDFISFPSMHDVFREIVNGVSVPIKGVDLRVFSKEQEKNFERPPVYFVDGIPTFDSKYVLNLNPSTIDVIGLISSEQSIKQFGYLGRNGIVAINSKSDKSFPELPEQKEFVKYLGYLPKTEYTPPTYFSKKPQNSRIPDLRSLLFWDPALNVNTTGKLEIEFYTSDEVGEYKVLVQGVAKDGSIISELSTFEVR